MKLLSTSRLSWLQCAEVIWKAAELYNFASTLSINILTYIYYDLKDYAEFVTSISVSRDYGCVMKLGSGNNIAVSLYRDKYKGWCFQMTCFTDDWEVLSENIYPEGVGIYTEDIRHFLKRAFKNEEKE
jgi:hypothetical protein